MTNWTDIRPDFDKKWDNKTYQQLWEQKGFTKQEVQSWLNAGFKPADYHWAFQWKNHNFTSSQTQPWLATGLDKEDYHFASWLRYKNHFPQSVKDNLRQLRASVDYNNYWLEQNYPDQSITKLYIFNKNLTGQLDLTNYVNLQELDCSHNQLTELNLSANYALEVLDYSGNQLSNLNFLQTLPNPKNLTNLNLSYNPLFNQTLDFLTSFINLKELYLSNTNFTGSLSPLSNLTKLKTLDITNTNLNSDIELLPENLETVFAKNISAITKKMKDFGDAYGGYKYQSWRTTCGWLNNNLDSQQKETITKLNISNQNLTGELDFSDLPNLKSLNLSNNNISGSLQSLQILTKLEHLDISSTNLDSDLEYLPNSLKTLICNKTKLTPELAPYGGTIQGWRESRKRDQQIQLLQKQNQLFTDQEKEINYLELRIQELTNLIKTQKERIINAFLLVLPEKELIKDLIITHLEFTKFKKQEVDSSDYEEEYDELEKKCRKIKKRLRTTLNKEIMNGVQRILNDCEELVTQELELESRLNKKSLLIEDQKQITDGNEDQKQIIIQHEETQQFQLEQCNKERQKSLLIAKLEGKLEAQQEEIHFLRSYSPLQTEETWLITHLKAQSILTDKETNQIKELLGAKRIFLNTRQITIKGLQNCYNKLKGNKKYAKVDEVANLINASGAITNSLTFGVPKALGGTINAINASFKRKFSDKRSEEFQQLLINDKDNLSLLEDLIIDDKIIQDKSKKSELFANNYQIFNIDSCLWENKPLSTPEEMEQTIILLTENLKLLETELNLEEKELKELMEQQYQVQVEQIEI